MGKTQQRVSAETKARVRDYAVAEPSFTVAFAAWELGLSTSAIYPVVEWMLAQGIVHEIEPRSGPYAAVYAYNADIPASNVRRLFAELDDARLAGVGVDAQQRGVIVPHTRIEGSSHKPGRDKRRQERGVRLARGKGAA